LQRFDEEDQEDFGQIDGDASVPAFEGAVPFQPSSPGQPWLRAGTPPWHLWGNNVPVSVKLLSGVFGQGVSGQLTKVTYKRPETWHWLFSAKILDFGALPPVGTTLNLAIIWDVTVGIGRSVQQNAIFDLWNIPITSASGNIRGRTLWATQAVPGAGGSLGRLDASGTIDPTPPTNFVNELVAQNIQLNASAALTLSGALAGYPYSAVVELGASWAPKNHIRPDWFLKSSPDSVFTGEETGGS